MPTNGGNNAADDEKINELWNEDKILLNSLKDEEMEAARGKLMEVLKQITPLEIPKAVSAKRRVLLKAAQKNLGQTAKLLNFLIDIHLLT